MEKEQILASVLARTDALFIPIRKPREVCMGQICDMRMSYKATGVSWTSDTVGADDNASQKRVQYVVRKLVSDGLVTMPKRYRLKLTELGYQFTRALCGMETIDNAFFVLHQLWETEGRHFLDHVWVREDQLNDTAYGSKGYRGVFAWFEELMCPLLVAGLANSNSTREGHVSYALTTDGILRLMEEPPEAPPLPAKSDECLAYYSNALKQEIAALHSIDPEFHNNVGQIDLPSSLDIGCSLEALERKAKRPKNPLAQRKTKRAKAKRKAKGKRVGTAGA